MTQFYFDVWDADSLNGTALGELTQAYAKSFRAVDQAIGSGQFTINRHDSQYLAGWCAQDNLIRVRLVAGGPFAYNDSRYVHAFFIESGDDAVLSESEEGGDEITRGGRSAVAILERAVMNYTNDVAADARYVVTSLKDGQWHVANQNAGAAMRIALRNAVARTPNPLDPLTHDFNQNHDSNNVTWTATNEDWDMKVGDNLLTVLSVLAGGEFYWRCGPDLVLHAYNTDPGVDRSGTVSFVKGTNIREAAQRDIYARSAMSDALVQGTTKSGTLTYAWKTDSSARTLLGGRREGFVEYEATPTNSRLLAAGGRAITKALHQYQGPTTLGVIDTTGKVAFTDYIPGDSVLINIPGEFDSVTSKVYAIVMEEREADDADIAIELESSPFDGQSTTLFDNGTSTGGGGGSTSKCGECPPLTPHVPGTTTGDELTCAQTVTDMVAGMSKLDEQGYAGPPPYTAKGQIDIPIVPTSGQTGVIIAGVVATNTNVPGDTNVAGTNGFTTEYSSGVLGGEHPWTAMIWKAIASASGTYHATAEYDPGYGANNASYWFGVAAFLRTQATTPVQSMHDVGVGQRKPTFSSNVTAGNIIVMVVSQRASSDASWPLNPTDLAVYPSTGWTVLGQAKRQVSPTDYDKVAVIVRCVQAGDGNQYGGGVPGTGTSAVVSIQEWVASGFALVPTTPVYGTQHTEQFTGDGTTTVLQTAYPYEPASVHVTVGGVAVVPTETTPTTGTLTLPFAPASGAKIIVQYQNAGTTATGGAGTTPTAGGGTVPATQQDDQWKQPVRVATTANITIATDLNNGDTLDGVTLATGDRVLVKDQTTGSQNGIYIVGASPARAVNFDESSEVVGSLVYVVEGTVNGGQIWRNTNTTAPTIGTTALTFAEVRNLTSMRVISPTQLSANTDNWNPTGLLTAEVIRASTDASRNLTGIVAPTTAKSLILANVGANDLVLKHDVTSTAANRFYCPNDTDVTVQKDSAAWLVYDLTSSRWRVVSVSTGSGGGSALTVKDEGTSLDTAVTSLDFTGAGVTASVVGHAVTVAVGAVAAGFVGCTAYNNAVQNVANNSMTPLTLNSEEFDSDGFHSTSSNTSRMTIPAGLGGKYLVIGSTYGYSGTTGTVIARLLKNGSTEVGGEARGTGAASIAGNYALVTEAVLNLAAGDYIELNGYQTSGSAQDFGHASSRSVQTTLSIVKLDSGKVGNGIGCSVWNAGTQSIPTSTDPALTFDSEEFDTDGFHSTSSNTDRITIPAGLGGKYLVTGRTTFAANASGFRQVYLDKNGGTPVRDRRQPAGSSASAITLQVSDVLDLVPGDYITLHANQDSGGSLNVGAASGYTASRLSVMRLDSGSSNAETFVGQASSTSAFSTSSTSFTDLTGMSVTGTTGAHRCLVKFVGTVSNSTFDAWTAITLLIDGSNVQGGSTGWITVHSSSTANGIGNVSFEFLTDVLSAGSHTFKIQMRVSSGTGKIREEGTYRLQVTETQMAA